MGKTYIGTDSMEEQFIKEKLNGIYGKNAMVPQEMEVTNKIGVTVWTMSKTKVDKKYFETETLLTATRIVNTFKPKRNHKVVKVEFEEVRVLV